MRSLPCSALSLPLILSLASTACAQPTYRLDVKPDLRPAVTLQLTGQQLTRSAVSDDPGFRLQYHFTKDGKTVATVEARAQKTLALPRLEVGSYTVVVELFYPAYKGGQAQKGEFRPISNTVAYRVEAGPPLRVVPVPMAALRAALGVHVRPGR